MEIKERFINPFTDFGFKKLFGSEPNKDLLIDFLNTTLPEAHKVHTLTYSNNEYQGLSTMDRKAVFDIFCTNEKGDKFIVELQKAKQEFFKDRSIYYSTFPIQEQAKKNKWNYKLNAVYTIAILDFVFSLDNNDGKVMQFVQLKDSENNVFYDKLTYIYLLMQNFNKTVDELETNFDKWLFVIKNLNKLTEIPPKLKNKIFMKFFGEAEVANLAAEERVEYEQSLKVYRDLQNVTETAMHEGYELGYQKAETILLKKVDEERRQKDEERRQKDEERRQKNEALEKQADLVKFMVAKGTPITQIADILNLSEAEVIEMIQ